MDIIIKMHEGAVENFIKKMEFWSFVHFIPKSFRKEKKMRFDESRLEMRRRVSVFKICNCGIISVAANAEAGSLCTLVNLTYNIFNHISTSVNPFGPSRSVNTGFSDDISVFLKDASPVVLF